MYYNSVLDSIPGSTCATYIGSMEEGQATSRCQINKENLIDAWYLQCMGSGIVIYQNIWNY